MRLGHPDMRCETCAETFDPAKTPRCPACLAQMWLATEAFIRPKHDPRPLPMVWESYRSVLNPDFVTRLDAYLRFAAREGRWFFDRYYDMWVHVTFEPLGHSPGGGIPVGLSQPEHALDSLIIAEADSPKEAHGFAVNRVQFQSQIDAGEFEVAEACEQAGCSYLRLPGASRCIAHA